MTKRVIFTTIYLCSALSGLVWLSLHYGSFSLKFAPFAFLTAIYGALAISAVAHTVSKGSLVSAPDRVTISPKLQKLIAAGLLFLPVPIFIYCLYFAAVAATFDGTGASQERVATLNAIEMTIFGRATAFHRSTNAPSAAAVQDVDFGPYMAKLQRGIKRKWYPPKGSRSRVVAVIFKIHKGGELSHLRLGRSSGIAAYDLSAIKAVENAAPFAPLPAGSPADIDIQFTFDYNVFSGDASDSFTSSSPAPTPVDAFTSAVSSGDSFSSAPVARDRFAPTPGNDHIRQTTAVRGRLGHPRQ